MCFRRSTRIATLEQLSDLRDRVQQLESDGAALRERLAGEAALRTFSAQMVVAAQSALAIGFAIEAFARAMRVPLRRGRAGGPARARQASRFRERWLDGRFMAHEDRAQINDDCARVEYMRYAAGGIARATNARRQANGTFMSNSD